METVSGSSYTESLVASGFTNPTCVLVDGQGNIIVGDFGSYDPPNQPSNGAGRIYFVTDIGGPASSQGVVSGLPFVTGIAEDPNGNLFVTGIGYIDFPTTYSGSSVVEISPASPSGTVSTITTNVTVPAGIVSDPAGDLFVAEYSSNLSGEIFELAPSGGAYTQTTLIPGLVSYDGQFNFGAGMTVDANGNLYFLDNPYGTDNGQYVVQADFSVAPALTFPNTNVGGTSEQTVTIRNIGSAALDFEIPASGNNPAISSGYELNSTALGTCPLVASGASDPGTLAPAGQCTLPVSFAPESLGAIPGTLSMMDNNLGAQAPDYATQTISLNGTGTAAAASLVVSAPGTAQVATSFNLTVTAEDSHGNIFPTYTGKVHFTSSDPLAVLPADSMLTSGTGTFAATLNTLGAKTITATDTSNPSLTFTVNLTVLPGPTTQFVITGTPSSILINTPFQFTITAEDVEGNPTGSAYTGTLYFSSSDSHAQLPANTTLTNGTGTFTATFETGGSQVIYATDTVTSTLYVESAPITVLISNLVVTTNLDDPGYATNCTAQATPGTGTDASCSLRDALLEATALGGANISFDSTQFSASNSAATNTITLGSAGTIAIGQNTNITGPTTGTGSAQVNLVTVSGNNSTSIFSTSGIGVVLSNLAISNGLGALTTEGTVLVEECTFSNNSGVAGAAIYNSATLTVTNSTFSNNSAGTESGGAIRNHGPLTLSDSTFSGNSALNGGAIDNLSTLKLTNSTFTGNSASQAGGAIYNQATVFQINAATISGNSAAGSGAGGGIQSTSSSSFTIRNSIVSGNGTNDIVGSYTQTQGGNRIGIDPIDLEPLGNYGGLTQTMPPLPGSSAICRGSSSVDTITTDQRGVAYDPLCPRGAGLIDSGAVQTHYALSFTTQPGSLQYTNQAVTPSPVVAFTESGNYDVTDSVEGTVTVTDTASLLGGTTTAALSGGTATFSALSFSTTTTGDTLIAMFPVGGLYAVSPASNSFNVEVVPPVPLGNLETAIDATTGSTTVNSNDSIYINGWAADPKDGAPVASLKIYIDGVAVTAPTVGEARPDVAAYYNNQSYLDSGFTLYYPASSLSAGAHTVTAIATNKEDVSTTLGPRTINVNVVVVYPPPIGNLETAQDASTGSTTVKSSDSIYINGWIADPTDGSPMSNVHVLIDGVSVGTPTLGISRPDVATYYSNSAYTNSGFTMYYSAAQLSASSHTITVVGTDSHSVSTTLGPLTINVIHPSVPLGNLDSAVDATTGSSTISKSTGTLYVGGWAADYTDNGPAKSVQIYIDGTSFAAATLGISRPDVAAYYSDSAWTNSGFHLYTSVSTLSTGSHSVTAVAKDSLGDATTLGPLTFTVGP
jgi:predicted outer membrane repeat protein